MTLGGLALIAMSRVFTLWLNYDVHSEAIMSSILSNSFLMCVLNLKQLGIIFCLTNGMSGSAWLHYLIYIRKSGQRR